MNKRETERKVGRKKEIEAERKRTHMAWVEEASRCQPKGPPASYHVGEEN